jgi:hypothetical protein
VHLGDVLIAGAGRMFAAAADPLFTGFYLGFGVSLRATVGCAHGFTL